MESLTHALAQKALSSIEDVERMGGMTRAVEAGMPKLRIEEAAARRQARIDRGLECIVGVNAYQVEGEAPIDVRVVDNAKVREGQIARLAKVRGSRDEAATERALDALSKAADTGEGNLLELSIHAARARASVGEISTALEKVFGCSGVIRPKPRPSTVFTAAFIKTTRAGRRSTSASSASSRR
jgi:methylmalonyl-CoA mutase